MVLVDAAKHGFLDALLAAHSIGAATEVLREARFYRDDLGNKHPLEWGPQLQGSKLTEIAATAAELDAVADRLHRRLGPGEVESIALVVARGHRFCTADRPAVRALKDIELLDRWVPLEELLDSLNPPRPVPDAKYSRAAAEPK